MLAIIAYIRQGTIKTDGSLGVSAATVLWTDEELVDHLDTIAEHKTAKRTYTESVKEPFDPNVSVVIWRGISTSSRTDDFI